MKQFGKVAAEGTVEEKRSFLRAFTRTVELDPETGKGRLETHSLRVMAAVQEKKDSPESRPSSLTLVAGSRYVVEKEIPGMAVEFTYLTER
ncbi:MAG TPA: hypothetical protein VMZ92_05770 [Planctomycetota bacterium]|nr:hypothetical protein [Planctomycetota bacterium]